MKLVARVVSILLLLAIVPSLISLQPASSQNLTTITSLRTITTEATVTRLSTSTGQTTTSETFTTTLFTTSSLAQPKKIVSKTFALPAPGPEYGCIYSSGNLLPRFSAQAGQVVTATLSSDSEVNFYLMTAHDYDIWVGKSGCGVDTALVEAEAVKTYSLDFVIPNTDQYRFLLLNFSHENEANVTLTAQFAGTATQSSVVIAQTKTLQVYSTETGLVEGIVTETSTSLLTEQGGTGSLIVDSNMLLMVAGIVVGVGVVVGIFMLRSRQGKPKAGPKLYEPVVEEKPSPESMPPPRPSRALPPGMKFCVHCGTAIPKNARFCTKIDCGKPQD